MKYEELKEKAHELENKISLDRLNFEELLEKDPSYINICRICLGLTTKSLAEKSNVLEDNLKKIIKGKEISTEAKKKIINYIIIEFNQIEKNKITDIFMKNYVFIDKKENIKNWMKYDSYYHFLIQNFGLFFLPLFFSFLYNIQLFEYLFFENIIIMDLIKLLMLSLPFQFLIILRIFLGIKKSPMTDEIWMYSIAEIMGETYNYNDDQIRKYLHFISQQYKNMYEDSNEHLPSIEDKINQIYYNLGNVIQENILPLYKKGDYDIVREIFLRFGHLLGNKDLSNLIELINYLSQIEKKYQYHPYPGISRVDIIRPFFYSSINLFKTLVKESKYLLLRFSIILIFSTISSIIIYRIIGIEDINNKVFVFLAMIGICITIIFQRKD